MFLFDTILGENKINTTIKMNLEKQGEQRRDLVLIVIVILDNFCFYLNTIWFFCSFKIILSFILIEVGDIPPLIEFVF